MMHKMSWLRMLGLVTLLLALGGEAVGPTGQAVASTTDCGDGHKWDDAQQMCVDQEPSDCVNGQVWDDLQQMCVDSSTDSGSTSDQECTNGQVWDATQQMCADPTPSNGDQGQNAGAMGTASMAVSVVQCPTGYAFDGSTNPASDCMQPLDGVPVSWASQGQQPLQQSTSGGGITFTNLAAGPFTLAASVPNGVNAAWSCQSIMGQPISGQGASIAAEIADGEQASCTFFVSSAGISIVVHTFACPVGYDANGANANPVTDCATSQDGVQFTVSGQSTGFSSQSKTGDSVPGTVTFGSLQPDTYTITQASSPSVASAFVSQCVQSTITNPSIPHYPTVTNGAIQYQFDQNDLMLECSWYIVPATSGTPASGVQPTSTATPSANREGIVGDGADRGSIRIVTSMCPVGFDPTTAQGADLSRVCTDQYRFAQYPITYTAFGTTHDTAVVGTLDTFFGWVEWDNNLGPDTYRVEAALPAGVSTVLFESCGEGGTVADGKVTFLAPVTAGGLFACSLALVRDPNAPTPTRAPNTDKSQLSVGTAVCPAGFVATDPAANLKKQCVGGPAGIRYGVMGAPGGPAIPGVGGTDTVSLSPIDPGIYRISASLPTGIASAAAMLCQVFDIPQSQWVDDVLPPLTVSGTDISTDVTIPGAMIWICTLFVVPTGPSPTPSPTITPTATNTPTPTVTPTPTSTPTTAPSDHQSGTTSQQPAQSQSGTTSQPQSSGHNAIVIGPPTATTTTTIARSVTPTARATAGTASTVGTLSVVIHSFICPTGTQAGGEGNCLTTYPGAVFIVRGATTGISRQSVSGDILPDAALFTELPPDTYAISPQRAPGIASTFGSCELLARSAGGMATAPAVPVTPAVVDDMVLQTFDTTAHVFVCQWYSVPDATFAGLPTPTPPQGVSITVHAFNCPVGYDPAKADANPGLDCLVPARGVPFSLAGRTAGRSTQLTTGVVGSPTPDPKQGTTRTGTVTFTNLAADSYALTQGNVDGPVNASAACSLATATNADVPVYPAVANGTIIYQMNDNEALTCIWYIVPNTDHVVPPPPGTAQGGAAKSDAPVAAPTTGASQGGATDDSAQPTTPATGSGQGGATDDPAPTETPVVWRGGRTQAVVSPSVGAPIVRYQPARPITRNVAMPATNLADPPVILRGHGANGLCRT